VGEIIDLGVKLDIIDKGGAWFTIRDQRLQGRDAAKKYLQDTPEVREEIEKEIRDNAWKLMTPQARRAAQATGRAAEAPAVDISADDFDQG
jgi:recombination protein RecA